MTREEAAANLLQYLKENEKPGSVWATSLDMAIAALREQEERSKGCDWCGFFFDHSGKFQFCPQCGRRLEEV